MSIIKMSRFFSSVTNLVLAATMLVFVVSNKSQAQDVIKNASPIHPYLGIKIGGNFSYLDGKSWDNGIKSNLLGGVYAGIKGLRVGIQAEALFSQSDYTTGSSFHDVYSDYYNNIGDSLKNGSFRVNKLSIPILLQLKISGGLWLQLGAQFSGIVSVDDKDKLLHDAKSIFTQNNIAGIGGLTWNLGKFNIGARYLFDFSNINNTNVDEVWKQHILQVHVGVKIL
jgi:hypothetical protein